MSKPRTKESVQSTTSPTRWKSPVVWSTAIVVVFGVLLRGRKTIENFQSVGKAKSLEFDSAYARGEALMQDGKMADAVASLRKAVDLRPDSSDARHDLGV